MSDTQKLTQDVLRKHRIAYLDQFICSFCRTTFDSLHDADAHQAAEIDKALGGLTRQWTIRYRDGDVTMRPSPGAPTQRAIEIVKQQLDDREIVVGWVSGWSAP